MKASVRFFSMHIYKLIFIILFASTFMGCNENDTWHGVVYPDRSNLSDALQIGHFDTLEECGIASIKILDRLHAFDNGDYECGKNCQKDSYAPSLLNCEETLKADIPFELARASYPRDNISHALEKMFIHKIYRTYNSEYLTYPGMLKAWLVRMTISFKMPISKELTMFAETQKKFVYNVFLLGMVSDGIVPTMEMCPTEFEVYFDGLAKEKQLRLKLSE